MRTIILLVIYILLSILILIPVILFCYLMKREQPLFSISKWALRLGQIVLGIRLDVSGIEKIEKKAAYVFMSNHLSLVDGPLLFMLIPKSLKVILKKEVFRIPVISQGMRQAGFIPVDRKSIRGGKESIDRASRVIREKAFSFLIFPEGTRSRDGKLQPFKRGGFLLALNSGASIVPVSIKGSYELMPKGSFFAKRGDIRVIFHSPLSVAGFKQDRISELRDRVRDIIQSGLGQDAEACQPCQLQPYNPE